MDPVSKAQADGGITKRYSGLRPPWPKGVSGNIGGRPRKAPITKIFERIFRKAQNRKDIEESILRVLLQGKMASVLMVREAAERIEGKVVEKIEVSGTESLTGLSDSELAEKLVKMDEELAKRCEELVKK